MVRTSEVIFKTSDTGYLYSLKTLWDCIRVEAGQLDGKQMRSFLCRNSRRCTDKFPYSVISHVSLGEESYSYFNL